MAGHIKFAALALFSGLLATAALGQGGPAAGPFSAGAPDSERGARLYVEVGCYQCHGYAAHGGAAPKLGPKALAPFVIAAYIRNPTGVMPPYDAKVLSDQDVADIAAWLRTLPESPEPEDIAILPGADSIAGGSSRR